MPPPTIESAQKFSPKLLEPYGEQSTSEQQFKFGHHYSSLEASILRACDHNQLLLSGSVAIGRSSHECTGKSGKEGVGLGAATVGAGGGGWGGQGGHSALSGVGSPDTSNALCAQGSLGSLVGGVNGLTRNRKRGAKERG